MNHFLRSFNSLLAAVACWLACAASALAVVQVDFNHTYTGATDSLQNTGNITLAFTVNPDVLQRLYVEAIAMFWNDKAYKRAVKRERREAAMLEAS